MNRHLIVAIALLMLLLPRVCCVRADLVDSSGGLIAKAPYIQTPTNTTYNYSSLTLNITFHAAMYGNLPYSMNYSLDGKANQTIQLGYHYFGFDQQSKNYIDATVPILNLSDDTHNLTVYLQVTMINNANNITTYKSYYDIQTVVFTIAVNPSNPTN
jgi:hypothetical protein